MWCHVWTAGAFEHLNTGRKTKGGGAIWSETGAHSTQLGPPRRLARRCLCLPTVLQAVRGRSAVASAVPPQRSVGSARWLFVQRFKIPLVWFWHAVLSRRGPCRTYGAIQSLCRAKWVLSSGWRLNVMALSPGSRVFHPLMFALIRRSARSAPLRSSSVSALLNYAFSWLEYWRRVCHFWMFTLNKTDAMSHVLHNPQPHGCISVASTFCIKKYQVVLLRWGGGVKIKREMMLHEHKINNTDSSRAAWMTCQKN